ncbi:hypothetical protein COMNV_00441 [Commensalibacter sp. Nvir]|uniref:phage baseplate protein n=1 Tax=Commensalibacter sp. Nvir TaxID=3069817 RepID=UPI002D33F376|nr:hypothetical protein COMNV_00441 [Commensalibacter sp. Nvir]
MATLSTFLSGLVSKSTSFELTDLKTNETVDIKTTVVKDAKLTYEATLMQNQNEMGMTLTDSKIINAMSMHMTVFCDDGGFKKLNTLYKGIKARKTLFRVKLKTFIIDNVVLMSLSEEQTSEILTTHQVRLVFSEIMLNPSQSNTSKKQDGDSDSVYSTIKRHLNKAEKQVKDLVKGIV